ncbi:SWIM zinc finger family protein [Desulfogranum mediterraneum]|uniref:SWIM zinc finger family protein n=1 Tax=Desulfogranum mediterraneum TaxID=160661 RepID=UPI00040856DA|nr:hypothetical protein [Desulfogranum mediterraneum]
MPTSYTPANEDIFFFDREDLQALADQELIGQGLRCFQDHRVLEIDQDENRLWARVEDEEFSSFPLDIQIAVNEEAQLFFSCDCEPSLSGICLHQLAVLFAYADKRQEMDGLLSAVDTAIKDRIKRAKSEVQVEAEWG